MADSASDSSADAWHLCLFRHCADGGIFCVRPLGERHAGRFLRRRRWHCRAYRRRGQNHRSRAASRPGKSRTASHLGRLQAHRRPPDHQHEWGGPDEASLFGCCVDLDKRSLNTEDNAFEATVWARKRGFRSLIVVTSTYHMPRTLIELRQSMPEVELVPYPVKSPRMETEWWNDPRTSWVLCKEYLKFVTASARYAANMLATPPSSNKQSSQRTINARMD